ncbi:hypothetical protein DXG01_008101 [Tephrocybe rancida]|nr:hypothetical protein DXG01_008101 [Tephrocybe rancida]
MPATRQIKKQTSASRRARNQTPATRPAKEQTIPRPPNSFFLYRSDRCKEAEFKEKGGVRLTLSQISKAIGAAWRAETFEIKMLYERKAEEKKLEHSKKFPEYRYQPQRKGVETSNILLQSVSRSPGQATSNHTIRPRIPRADLSRDTDFPRSIDSPRTTDIPSEPSAGWTGNDRWARGGVNILPPSPSNPAGPNGSGSPEVDVEDTSFTQYNQDLTWSNESFSSTDIGPANFDINFYTYGAGDMTYAHQPYYGNAGFGSGAFPAHAQSVQQWAGDSENIETQPTHRSSSAFNLLPDTIHVNNGGRSPVPDPYFDFSDLGSGWSNDLTHDNANTTVNFNRGREPAVGASSQEGVLSALLYDPSFDWSPFFS